MLIVALSKWIDEAWVAVDALQPVGAIGDYQTLAQVVVRKELSDEVANLEAMVLLGEEHAIRARFIELCRIRDERNRGTVLHVLEQPETLCNVLYFNLAKVLYPGASFGTLCTVFLPLIEKEWIVQLEEEEMPHSSVPLTKRRRLQPCIGLREVGVGGADSALNPLPVVPGSFSRLVVSGRNVFVLDTIAAFNFKLHGELHQKLAEKSPELQKAIASHNESLAELYGTIARWYGEGATLREFIWPIVQRMAVSGTRSGSGEVASFDGSWAALRLVDYYHALPEPLKNALGECNGSAGLCTFAKAMLSIENRECIETVALYLQAIVDNPANEKLLRTTPYMSHEEKEALCLPYKNVKKGEPIVEFNRVSRTISLPAAFRDSFYQRMDIDDVDHLVALLTTFPTTEYLAFLCQATLDKINFVEEMASIAAPMNSEQLDALVMAITDERVRAHLGMTTPRLHAAIVSTRHQQVIDQFFGKYSLEERLHILNSSDGEGKTALHYLAEADDEDALQIFLGLYPVDAEILLDALNNPDRAGKTALHYAAARPVSLNFFVGYYLEHGQGNDTLLHALNTPDSEGKTVLHWAAGNRESMDTILNIYRADDEEYEEYEEEDERLMVLSATDHHGNTVLHCAAVDPDGLCFLLGLYPDVHDMVDALCESNKDGNAVLHLGLSHFYPLLTRVLELFIENDISEQSCAHFLERLMNNEGCSPLESLAKREEGRIIVRRLEELHPNLRQCFSLKRRDEQSVSKPESSTSLARLFFDAVRESEDVEDVEDVEPWQRLAKR